jgi:hypothetical protein
VAGATGVAADEATEAALVPAALVAVTVQVYDVPFVRPVITIGLADPVPVCPPHVAV